jgi:DNA polymerase III delta subunit
MAAAKPSFNASMRLVVLSGDDTFLMPRYTQELTQTLQEAYGDVEAFSFDGATTEPAPVLDELRSYGLLQQHKLVILDNADAFLASKRESGSSPRQLMERYAQKPADHSTLLMRCSSWRKSKLDGLIQAAGAIVKIAPLDESSCVRWCQGRAAKEWSCQIERPAAELLVARIGTQLARLDAELGKLAACAAPAETITTQHVAEMVTMSRHEQAWIIQQAIIAGPGPAMRTLHELLSVSLQPEALITWAIGDLLSKLHGASVMLRNGANTGEVCRERKIFGPARDSLLAVARRQDPGQLALLMSEVAKADVRTRSGYGNARRTLEGLTVRLADMIDGHAA